MHSREASSMALYAGVFALLTASCMLPPKSFFRRFRPLATQVSAPPSPAWYLAYFNGDLEHSAVYNNLEGAADALKHADVLLLGNSRMQYAFRDQETLRRFFPARGLRYFILAFGYGEGSVFASAIIRKFDLHPHWVIVNADPFFGKPLSVAASQAMSTGNFGAWKIRFESVASLAVEGRLHRIIPYVAPQQWDFNTEWIYYRAKSDGTLRLAAWHGTPGAMWEDLRNGGQPIGPAQVAEGERFKNELRARGARLVLTWIPPSSANNAKQFASALQVPLVMPDATGLTTIDGSHLDKESSKRFSASFLDAFGRIVDETRR